MASASSYARIPSTQATENRGSMNVRTGIFVSSVFSVSIMLFAIIHHHNRPVASAGVASEEVFGQSIEGDSVFEWTNAMLNWQRTGFHFQPEKNWMNGN